MSQFQQRHKLADEPIHLSEEEMKDPISVIKAFFEDYSLGEVREIYEQADHACLASDFPPFDNAEDRDRLLYYRKGAEKVLEAAFLLVQQNKTALLPTFPKKELVESKRPLNGEIDLNDLQTRVVDIQHKMAIVVQMVVEAWGKAALKL